jgi:hypothetical protein
LALTVTIARNLRAEYADVLDRLEDNPYQFPLDTDPVLRDSGYHKAIFYKRCKAVFLIEDNKVYLDAVADCRQSSENINI